MEISQTLPPELTARRPQTGAADAMINSDFETFLRMLTTQLQNQDPLNPLESTDFAVQLATFSGVEQQVRSNQLLESLAGQMGLMGMAELAGWVGMEALSTAPAHFSGTPLTLLPEPPTTADLAVLVVHDAYGREVGREPLARGNGPVLWGGVGAAGYPLPEGKYSFSLESYAQGDLLSQMDVPHYARIDEARREGGDTVLILEGGIRLPSSEVSALRRPTTGG